MDSSETTNLHFIEKCKLLLGRYEALPIPLLKFRAVFSLDKYDSLQYKAVNYQLSTWTYIFLQEIGFF